jgi:arabinofuranosyltransferase
MQSAAAIPAQTKTCRSTCAVVLLCLLVVMVFGAAKLAFLCDDAYITFRYVSNAHDGHGLVWNAPPFQPVEGYTGFLWALVLWATWSWFGVEPPDAANVLSIACGVLLFAVTARAAFRLRSRASLPVVVPLLTLAVIVSNRTFLQWMTSGLETALFDLTFVAWVLLAFRSKPGRDTRWFATWSAAAAAAALTRPDGLLLVVVTAAAAFVAALRRERRPGQALLGQLPFVLVLAHVAWRRSFYGEWLPNTYFAKVVAPWPEAGLHYVFCFCFEHGAWLGVPIVVAWVAVECRRGLANVRRALLDNLPATAAVAAVVFHCGYYVFKVGGDHFEYRVFSQLIPLGGLAVAAMAARMRAGAGLPITCLVALGLAASIGWVQLALTKPRQVPDYDPVAPHVPEWLQPLARWYDRHQEWLQVQLICCRCNQHALALHGIETHLMPARARMQADPSDLPIVESVAVGFVGWALPDCAVIDLLGLSDWVAARTPVSDWNAWWLPKEFLQTRLSAADTNGDSVISREELVALFATLPGATPESAARFTDNLVLVMFAVERRDSLTAAEAKRFEAFVAQVRFMAHERVAPPAYVAALDPNVTVENRVVKVRKREHPMTADRVGAIEAEWREKIRRGSVR